MLRRSDLASRLRQANLVLACRVFHVGVDDGDAKAANAVTSEVVNATSCV